MTIELSENLTLPAPWGSIDELLNQLSMEDVDAIRRATDAGAGGGWPKEDRWRDWPHLAVYAFALLTADDPPAPPPKRAWATLVMDWLFVRWRERLPNELLALMVMQ